MPIDRVKPLKIEAPASGGTQTDDCLTETNVGQDYIDALGYCVQLPGASATTSDDKVTLSRASDSALQFADIPSGTLKLSQLLTDQLGRPGTHASVADFSHWLDAPADGYASGTFRQTSFVGSLPQTITWYASNAATVRLFQTSITYTGVLMSQRVHRLFAANQVIRTLTETFNYTGGLFSPSITRTWT